LDDTGGSKVHVRRVQAEWSGPPGLGKPAQRTKFHDEENWSAGDVVGTGKGQTSEDGIVPPERTPIDKAMVLRIG
jgi:hypothetical protein